MEDPFAALLKSLEPVFLLAVKRNGQYSLAPIRRLYEATQHYNPKLKTSYTDLLLALRESLPLFQKWQIDFNSLVTCMNDLAKKHHVPASDWNKILPHAKVSLRFPFSSSVHSSNIEFFAWMQQKMGKSITDLNQFELTEALIEHREHHGFSQKLNGHLTKNPDFLYHLIIGTERNFTKILNTRLSLYLTDAQIAKAIMTHLPNLVDKHPDMMQQVEDLVNKINSILSNGRSVMTLLRNGQSKSILERSAYFIIYQSENYKNRNQENTDLSSQESPFKI